jgi:dihydrofolate reductase
VRKILVMMSVSLDSFIEGPNRELDWHRVDEELHAHFNAELGAASAFLDGRVTWELMASYWPTADQDPASSPPEVEFAGIWREMPKIVYSRTLEQAGWNTSIARAVDPDEIRALRAQPGGDMFVGGADLAAEFQRLGLVDEYRVYVHPVVIGAGKPLFPPGSTLDLTLAGARTFGNGVTLLRYSTR